MCERLDTAVLPRAGASDGGRTGCRIAINTWGVRSPLFCGQGFEATVRAKAIGGQLPTGAAIEIVDPGSCRVLARVEPQGERCGADGGPDVIQGTVSLVAPSEPGLYKWYAVLDADGQGTPAQATFPFSVIPRGDRRVSVRCIDDKSCKPVPATVFFYDCSLKKTKPVSARADEEGRLSMDIVGGDDYRLEAVCEDYCVGFGSIPAGTDEAEAVIPMRNKFNVKMKRAF